MEAADTQALETGVRYAINDFVIGCKNDGIWNAIKASCILAGARTLAGALVPLVGTAPTNFNFVAGDYNRETGLIGDGSTKYLDSNRNNNADPQDSNHAAVYISSAVSSGIYFGSENLSTGRNYLDVAGGNTTRSACRGFGSNDAGLISSDTLAGVSRASSSGYTLRRNGASINKAVASLTPDSLTVLLFARQGVGVPTLAGAPRIAFYSIGESLDLAALDTRVSDLITAIGAAIP